MEEHDRAVHDVLDHADVRERVVGAPVPVPVIGVVPEDEVAREPATRRSRRPAPYDRIASYAAATPLRSAGAARRIIARSGHPLGLVDRLDEPGAVRVEPLASHPELAVVPDERRRPRAEARLEVEEGEVRGRPPDAPRAPAHPASSAATARTAGRACATATILEEPGRRCQNGAQVCEGAPVCFRLARCYLRG